MLYGIKIISDKIMYTSHTDKKTRQVFTIPGFHYFMVGASGLEPETSTVSG